MILAPFSLVFYSLIRTFAPFFEKYNFIAMNISYKWLKEYVDFDLTPQQVCDALTSTGLEVDALEEVQSIKGGLKGLYVGKVLTCEMHPDSDHLHVTTVDLGKGEPQQIVCGAPNVAAGQKVIVADLGCVLYDGDKEFVIKKSKLRGVESLGMICAEDEIGIGTDHAGIIVLPDDAVVGTPAAEYYHLESDWLIEVDITANRADALSHWGVARDLYAWLKQNGSSGRRFRRRQSRPPHRRSHREHRGLQALCLREHYRLRGQGVARMAKEQAQRDWITSNQQHRRHHQLRHDGTGSAPALLRC